MILGCINSTIEISFVLVIARLQRWDRSKGTSALLCLVFLSFSEDSDDSVPDIDGFLEPVQADIDDVDKIAGVVLDVDDDVEVAADANVDADEILGHPINIYL